MSFTLLLAVTAAVAASMGYMVARKHGDGPPDEGEGDERDTSDKKEEAKDKPAQRPQKKPAAKPDPAPFATLPLALGDVVSNGSDERWLAGAVVAREEGRVIASLFVAPEGKSNQAVAAFPAPRREVWWMAPTEVASPNEPPATIEIGGVAMARKARLPVKLERVGQGAPLVDDEGIWAVYDRGRDVAVVIASGGKAHAWAGTRLEEDEYDRLGGGGD
jgi:hypothetical protein